MEVLRQDFGRIRHRPSREQRLQGSSDRNVNLSIDNAAHILQPSVDSLTSPLPLSSNSASNARFPLNSFPPLHPPGDNQGSHWSGQGRTGGRGGGGDQMDDGPVNDRCEGDKSVPASTMNDRDSIMCDKDSLSRTMPREFSNSSCVKPYHHLHRHHHHHRHPGHNQIADQGKEENEDDEEESDEGGFHFKQRKSCPLGDDLNLQQQHNHQQQYHHPNQSENTESTSRHLTQHSHHKYPHHQLHRHELCGASDDDHQLWTNERILDKAELIAALRHEIKEDLRDFLKELHHQEHHQQLGVSSKPMQHPQPPQQQSRHQIPQQPIQRPFAIRASSRSSSRLPSPLQPVNPAPTFGPATNSDLYETHLYTQL